MKQAMPLTGGSARISPCTLRNDVIHLDVQVSRTDPPGIAEQAADLFSQVDAALARNGLGIADALSIQILLADMAEHDEFSKAWDKRFEGMTPPARICVEARLTQPGHKLEALVVAVKPKSPVAEPKPRVCNLSQIPEHLM